VLVAWLRPLLAIIHATSDQHLGEPQHSDQTGGHSEKQHGESAFGSDLAMPGEDAVLMQKFLTLLPFAIIGLLVAGLATGYVKFYPQRFGVDTIEDRRDGFQQKVRGVRDPGL